MAAGKLTPTDSIDIPIQGMTCASCVGRVEKAIRSVAGVTAANVNLATERAACGIRPGYGRPGRRGRTRSGRRATSPRRNRSI